MAVGLINVSVIVDSEACWILLKVNEESGVIWSLIWDGKSSWLFIKSDCCVEQLGPSSSSTTAAVLRNVRDERIWTSVGESTEVAAVGTRSWFTKLNILLIFCATCSKLSEDITVSGSSWLFVVNGFEILLKY